MTTDSAQLRPAVFFDRDGTLMEDVHYCSRPADVRVFADVPAALGRLQAAGFVLIMVTNQSGIGRGYFTEDDYARVQAECLRQIGEHLLAACYHCPDAPGGHVPRRKPEPGMLHEARLDHRIALNRSVIVGDSCTDVECGRRAGLAASILVLTGKNPPDPTQCPPDCIATNLTAAADWILAQSHIFHG